MRTDPRTGAREPEWNEVLAIGLLGLFAGMAPAVLTAHDLMRTASDQPYVFGWGEMLHRLPLSAFYSTDMGSFVGFDAGASTYGRPDHLPADAAALKLLELLYSAIGGTDFRSSWFLLFSAFQTISGVAVGLGLYVLARRLFGPASSGPLSILLVGALNPTIAIAAYLLRWDFFSAALAIWLLVALSSARDRWWSWAAAGVLTTLVALSKPQYFILVAPIAACLVSRESAGRVRRPAAMTAYGTAAVASAAGLLLAFRLSPRAVVALASYAYDKFPFATDAAGNLWQLVSPQHRLDGPEGNYLWTVTPDDRMVAGVSDQTWGWIMTAMLVLVTLAVAALWRPDLLTGAVWIGTVLYFDYWSATTRQTERFLLPAMLGALLLLGATWHRRHVAGWRLLVAALWIAGTLQIVATDFWSPMLRPSAWVLASLLVAFNAAPLILDGRRRGSVEALDSQPRCE